jgi:lipopolysaccharide export system permease protein
MKLIDRMLLGSFFKAWFVCFTSLVSLYIVIDLFNKLDEFFVAAQATETSLPEVVIHYYLYQMVLIFDRLCGVIVLLAAMFTIAWMQRHNELLPLLSAGVPTRRVLLPVLFGSLVMVALSLANREFLMPRIARQLENPANDPRGEQSTQVRGTYDTNGILIAGNSANRKEQTIYGFTCTIPERIGGGLFNIIAHEARYIPKSSDRLSGGWLLTRTAPLRLPNRLKCDYIIEINPGKFFLWTECVDFDLLTRSQGWYQYASTWDLFLELHRAKTSRLTPLAVQLHLRITVPLLTLIMVWMGVSLILRDQCRNVFINAGMCLVLAATFYATCYLARHLGEQEYLSPALAAWLPVLQFGPTAVVLFDAIHT